MDAAGKTLVHVNIAQIQLDLVRMKNKINREGSLSQEDGRVLKEKLKDFTTAIRDYQDLRNKKSVDYAETRKRTLLLQRFLYSPGDLTDLRSFESHYAFFEDADTGSATIDPLRQAMMRKLPVRLSFSHKEKTERPKEYEEGSPPKEVSTAVDRLARFSIALVEGCFLIVPMLIMAINPDQTKRLVTVLLAVSSFILLLSFGISVSNVGKLVATATLFGDACCVCRDEW
ncbi:hypothetical protein B0T14DRAFT_534160 [Immersiella caudata]|uniref:DUF6594 domain-containing protein n=1 Tax=Immersiella caudata TaxID=314043 RepID=A0AA40C6A4_9PEZI|nr:hypothetical protein B0T14DRAFT_534160 [Immersiella caudata]